MKKPRKTVHFCKNKIGTVFALYKSVTTNNNKKIIYIRKGEIIMSEIAVRHTREENYAHTNDWKKPYDGNIFDMFKDGSFELIDLSNPFGRGNPLWPSNGDFHIDRVQHMPMHYRLLQTFNSFHMHNSTHADSEIDLIFYRSRNLFFQRSHLY